MLTPFNKATIAAVLVIVASVAWLLIRPAPDSQEPLPDPPANTTPVDPGAAADRVGIDTADGSVDLDGLSQRTLSLVAEAAAESADESGAVAAALALLELGEEASTMTRAQVETLWRTIAAPDHVDRLLVENLASFDASRARFPNGAPTRYIPLATRVALTGNDTATVDLWFLLVIEVPESLAVQTWSTGSYRLERHHDRWLIVDVDVLDGPTPALPFGAQTVTTDTLASMLEGFEPA